jgi:nucleoside phosphorylase
MSSGRFDAFSERAAGAVERELAQRAVAFLRGVRRGDRLESTRLAAELGTPSSDAFADLLRVAQHDDVRLLEDATQIRCPHCGSRVDRQPLVEAFASDGEARCPGCEETIDDPAGLPAQPRYTLTAEADAEATAWQAEQAARPRRTAFLPCAFMDELLALHAQMAKHGDVAEKTMPNGLIYLCSEFAGRHVTWDVVAAFAEQGNAAAAALATQAAGDVEPAVAVFVGVAGGIPPDVDRGDVVAADIVHDYERGKDTKAGYQARSLQHKSAFRLKQRAVVTALAAGWRELIVAPDPAPPQTRPPKVVLQPIAAGGKVVASKNSTTAALIKQAAARAVAVEMEGAGFLEAIDRFSSIDGIVIRGISDLLDGKSRSDREGWQHQAAANAAAFAFQLLYDLDLGPE